MSEPCCLAGPAPLASCGWSALRACARGRGGQARAAASRVSCPCGQLEAGSSIGSSSGSSQVAALRCFCTLQWHEAQSMLGLRCGRACGCQLLCLLAALPACLAQPMLSFLPCTLVPAGAQLAALSCNGLRAWLEALAAGCWGGRQAAAWCQALLRLRLGTSGAMQSPCCTPAQLLCCTSCGQAPLSLHRQHHG